MKACMKSLTPEIQEFLSHWSLWVSATSSFSVKSSGYRKLSSKEMWPLLSFIFISLQRQVLSTLSVLTLFHCLVKPLHEEQQRHDFSGVRKETGARGQKTRQTTFHVEFAFVHSLLYRNISHGTQNTRTSSIDITFQRWNIPRRSGNRNPSKSSTGVWKLARNQRQQYKRWLADNNVLLLVMFFTFVCHAVKILFSKWGYIWTV